jgi:hypothetical protein
VHSTICPKGVFVWAFWQLLDLGSRKPKQTPGFLVQV